MSMKKAESEARPGFFHAHCANPPTGRLPGETDGNNGAGRGAAASGILFVLVSVLPAAAVLSATHHER